MLRKLGYPLGLGLIGFLVGSLSMAALSYYGVSRADELIVPAGIIGGVACVWLYWILARKYGW